MESSAVFAGFGGQGILSLGKVVAAAALAEGKEVSWLPSYGPEMRGGTANCTVVIADRGIGSPVVRMPNVTVAMNIPSCRKFAPLVRAGGILLVNSTLIPDVDVTCGADVRIVRVPATGIAIELGSVIAANMVMLGAFVAATRMVKLATVEAEVEHLFAKKPDALALSRRAIARGVLAAAAPLEAAHV